MLPSESNGTTQEIMYTAYICIIMSYIQKIDVMLQVLNEMKQQLVRGLEKSLENLEKLYSNAQIKVNSLISKAKNIKECLENPRKNKILELDGINECSNLGDWSPPVLKIAELPVNIFKVTKISKIFEWEVHLQVCSHSENCLFVSKCKKFHCRACLLGKSQSLLNNNVCPCGIPYSNKNIKFLQN